MNAEFSLLMSESLNVCRRNLSTCTLINAKLIKLCAFGIALAILESIFVFWQ